MSASVMRERIGSFARNLIAREATNYFRHAAMREIDRNLF
jgi:hypothetical protein